jgi:hypothetical protein
LDLNSTKLGNNASDRNALVAKVLSHLDDIDFDISNTEADVLGDAYEYLIGEFASGAAKSRENSHRKRYRLYWRRLSPKAKSVYVQSMTRLVVQVRYCCG